MFRIYAEGIAQFGVRQAESYHASLKECFSLLASQPRMARQRTEFQPPFRAHFHGSHVVAYMEVDRDILILRIFHVRQDWTKLM